MTKLILAYTWTDDQDIEHLSAVAGNYSATTSQADSLLNTKTKLTVESKLETANSGLLDLLQKGADVYNESEIMANVHTPLDENELIDSMLAELKDMPEGGAFRSCFVDVSYLVDNFTFEQGFVNTKREVYNDAF